MEFGRAKAVERRGRVCDGEVEVSIEITFPNSVLFSSPQSTLKTSYGYRDIIRD